MCKALQFSTSPFKRVTHSLVEDAFFKQKVLLPLILHVGCEVKGILMTKSRTKLQFRRPITKQITKFKLGCTVYGNILFLPKQKLNFF